MMLLKNILHSVEKKIKLKENIENFLKDRIKFFLIENIDDILTNSKLNKELKEILETKDDSYDKICNLECNIKSVVKDSEEIKEENSLIKKSCLDLAQDITIISQAINQIYILTETAVSSPNEDMSSFEEDLEIKTKKKKKVYH